MNKLFFKLYNNCGLFNQVISVELAVGLAFETQRQLILHGIFNKNKSSTPIYAAIYDFNNREILANKSSCPKIIDLLDWNNKESHILIDDEIETCSSEATRIKDLMQYYYSDTESVDFAEGRSLLTFDSNYDYDVRKTLGSYSRFFNNRSLDLDKQLKSVRFKPEYYELAKKIALSLGLFNGAHFRLTDHKPVFDPNNSTLDSGINKIDNGLPIVMCTDQPNNEIIKNSSYKYIMLDEYILNNFYKDFKQFKFKEEISFGALNNLVMHYSQNFIGSPGSTYSNYIFRGINQEKNIQWRTFTEEEHIQTGPYSWNGYNNKDTFTKQWWREWKESRICMI
jgi:hypothetical protein